MQFFIEPQKVKHLYLEKKKKTPDIKHNYLIFEKFDGWFGFIDYNTISGWGYPRNENRVIPSWTYTRDWFIQHIPKPSMNCRFIFEAYIQDTPFEILNGIFNRKKEDAKDVQFIIHDIVYLNSYFIHSRKENEAIERYKTLLSLLNTFEECCEYKLSVPKLLGISNEESIWNHYFESVTNYGGEGIILKRENSVYSPGKKDASLMKIKMEHTFDLICVNMFTTIGEKGYSSLNLKLRDKDNNEVIVRVGKDKDINEFNKNSPVGKVIEIKCMKKLADGGYREPRFKCVRFDKKISEID